MIKLEFQWDKRKATTNKNKHGVTFEEAKSTFFDENARLISDPDHSSSEERFILLGFSAFSKLLVVCHCYRESESVIRIFSAIKVYQKKMIYLTKLL